MFRHVTFAWEGLIEGALLEGLGFRRWRFMCAGV